MISLKLDDDNNNKAYIIGQRISGSVNFGEGRHKHEEFDSIYVEMKGTLYYYIKSTRIDNKGSSHDVYHNEERCVYKHVEQITDSSQNNGKFSFVLPTSSAAPSFRIKSSLRLDYEIQAVARKTSSDEEKHSLPHHQSEKLPIVLRTSMSETSWLKNTSHTEEVNEKLDGCCFCCCLDQGTVHARLFVSKTAVSLDRDRTIPMVLDIDNSESDASVFSVTLILRATASVSTGISFYPTCSFSRNVLRQPVPCNVGAGEKKSIEVDFALRSSSAEEEEGGIESTGGSVTNQICAVLNMRLSSDVWISVNGINVAHRVV